MKSEISEASLIIDGCNYDPRDKGNLIDMIKSMLNYPKKVDRAKFFIKEIFQDKIIMAWYPLTVPFENKFLNVPIKIYFKRKFQDEAPLILLDIIPGYEINENNKNIEPKTRKITTLSLEAWNFYSHIENVLDEIYESFSKHFPFNKILQKSSFSIFLNNNTYQQISNIKYNSFKDDQPNPLLYETLINDLNSNNEKDIENIYSVCPKCGFFIEMLDEDIDKIEFKCKNCQENKEEGQKLMLIQDYLLSININKCNLCQKEKSKEDLEFCTKCKIIICNDCIDNHIEKNKDVCNKEFFINLNEIGIKCFSHPNKNITCFCENCQRHLCHDCLKSKEHKGHLRFNTLEIEPSEEEINKFISILEEFKKSKNVLENEQKSKMEKMGEEIKEQEDIINKPFNDKVSQLINDMESEIENEKKKLKDECDKLYQEYLNQVKIKIENLSKIIKEKSEKYEKIFNEEKSEYEKKMDELKVKFITFIKKSNNDNLLLMINSFNNTIEFNEIIYNTFLENKNNYYANINFNKILSSLEKKNKDMVKGLLKDEIIPDNNSEFKNINEIEDNE